MFQIGFCMEPPSPGNVHILREMVFMDLGQQHWRALMSYC